MKSFILDENWDICLKNRNIFVGEGDNSQLSKDYRNSLAYLIAQKVANKIRLFKNDAYFDLDKGIDHFSYEFANKTNVSLLKKRIQEEALEVFYVQSARIENLEVKDRILSGTLYLELENGENIYVEI